MLDRCDRLCGAHDFAVRVMRTMRIRSLRRATNNSGVALSSRHGPIMQFLASASGNSGTTDEGALCWHQGGQAQASRRLSDVANQMKLSLRRTDMLQLLRVFSQGFLRVQYWTGTWDTIRRAGKRS